MAERSCYLSFASSDGRRLRCVGAPTLSSGRSSGYPWIPSRRKTAGLRENFEYGENYHNHWIRKASKGKSMEIMPGINSMFVDTPREEARTH